MTSQQIFSVWTKLKVNKSFIVYPHKKNSKKLVFLLFYGLKFSLSIRHSVRRRMDRLSANQMAAFYPYFVWYTIILLNVIGKLHCLSPKHLNLTSLSLVPNFCNFSKNRLFLDSN